MMEEAKKLLSTVTGVGVYNLDFTIALNEEIKQIFTPIINENMSKLDQLPEGIGIELENIEEIVWDKSRICISIVLKILADKFLVPKVSTAKVDLLLSTRLTEGILQFENPEINIELIEKGLKYVIIDKILEGFISIKMNLIRSLLDTKVNAFLRGPMIYQNHQLRYRLLNLETQKNDNIQHIKGCISLSSGALDVYKKKIELRFDNMLLMQLLLKKINDDIKEKIDQEVELLELKLIGPNKLSATGRAGAMGIKKEFEVFADIVFDAASQHISLEVENIQIKGGFLVRKGFEMVEPKVRKMIESAVDISLKELLSQPFELTVPVEGLKVKLVGNELHPESVSLDIGDDNALIVVVECSKLFVLGEAGVIVV